MTPDKEIYGFLSMALVLLSGGAYLYSILTNKTKPHAFTWVLWTLLTGVIAAAQVAGHAGAGAWATTLTASLGMIIVVFAFTRGERHITRGDWITFILGLGAIPLWYITKNPLSAAIVATSIDVIAYYPTFRKSYSKPGEEMILSYILGNIRHVLSILAMDVTSATTLLYPLVVFAVNTALIGMLTWRRLTISRRTQR